MTRASEDAVPPSPRFKVSAGLKRVLGRELITDAEVAVFELVKNSFDAGAKQVHIYALPESLVVADNGCGMTETDLRDRWLFVAYSAKRDPSKTLEYRELAAERRAFAGSKGIGRFSSDRLGEHLILQTRPKTDAGGRVHRIEVHWNHFEADDSKPFDQIPLTYRDSKRFDVALPRDAFLSSLRHGTVIELRKLRQHWTRTKLLDLKRALAKLINPFGSASDRFNIFMHSPTEAEEDRRARAEDTKKGIDAQYQSVVNGRVGNFVFEALRKRTTFIHFNIADGRIDTALTDRGELVYKIREDSPYKQLEHARFSCEIYYLNHSAKLTFAKRVGLPSVQFGSVFLFRNGFRVYPIGEARDDWFGFDRRKQQGHSRFLGTREIIGRVDVSASEGEFQEASSRNQGLIESAGVAQLRKAVLEHGLKRLEKYVVPVSWADKSDSETEDLSRLLTDSGRARVAAAVAGLVEREDIELLEYSKTLIALVGERATDFETSLAGVRTIAEKTKDKALLTSVRQAEKRFEQLRASERQARETADRERETAAKATERANAAEAHAEQEKRRSHFLEAVVTLDTATVLNLHHQITIYSVDLAQQIENFLVDTSKHATVSREAALRALDHIAFLNRKILAITRFATKAKFTLDSEHLRTDLAAYLTDYVTSIAQMSSSARLRIEVTNNHAGFPLHFNPVNVAIIVDNLISNARRAKASRVRFDIDRAPPRGLRLVVADNGRGFSRSVDMQRLFEMGYTTTQGSGLGLYHVRQVVNEMGGTIQATNSDSAAGAQFTITFPRGDKED